MLVFLQECDVCEMLEERTFRDNWTGLELCAECLSEVIDETSMSPASEGDNLIELLKDRLDYEPSDYYASF